MGHREHKAAAPKQITCLVATVSDTRTERTDSSGKLIQKVLLDNGHIVSGRGVKDEPSQIRTLIETAPDEVQVIILTGGTGISKRDITYETVGGLLEKHLDGFGEIFRFLSYQEIGSSAMLSRAIAGTRKGKVIFSLPGSEAAVRLAMEKLILPELGHLVQQLQK